MSWWQPHKFDEKKQYLQARMEIIREIRAFFDEQGFWEVETPVLQVCPVMDTHIHAFRVENDGRYLHTSPEFAMKKLMVAGVPKLYQICPVFRRDPETRLHSPEFTMIEWYRAPGDYRDIMKDCENLLRSLNVKELRYEDKICDPFQEWQRLSVVEAFKTYAGMDLDDDLKKSAKEAGVRVAGSDSWEDVFHAVMAEKIEPHLGVGVPTILYDYPVSMASLSRKKPEDERYAERFELYVCGVELANAFSELTDAAEQRQRFVEEMDLKEKLYGERYPIDEEFLEALEHGLPESGGIALGIDRLVMLATGAEDINQVLWNC